MWKPFETKTNNNIKLRNRFRSMCHKVINEFNCYSFCATHTTYLCYSKLKLSVLLIFENEQQYERLLVMLVRNYKIKNHLLFHSLGHLLYKLISVKWKSFFFELLHHPVQRRRTSWKIWHGLRCNFVLALYSFIFVMILCL